MNQVTQNICLQNNDKTYTVSGHLVSVVLILAAVVAGGFCCAKRLHCVLITTQNEFYSYCIRNNVILVQWCGGF